MKGLFKNKYNGNENFIFKFKRIKKTNKKPTQLLSWVSKLKKDLINKLTVLK